MASPNRQGGGGLSMQTLVIASSASLAAALVTSRLFPAGTVFTAALTPVIVAMVSEVLHRPVNRVTELREARRTAVREPGPLEPAEPEVRIHGHRPWGRIHPRFVIATGLAAFLIAAAALTLPELLFGGAVANSHRTTIFGGGSSTTTQKAEPAEQQTDTTTAPTQTETTPAQQAPTTTTD